MLWDQISQLTLCDTHIFILSLDVICVHFMYIIKFARGRYLLKKKQMYLDTYF